MVTSVIVVCILCAVNGSIICLETHQLWMFTRKSKACHFFQRTFLSDMLHKVSKILIAD